MTKPKVFMYQIQYVDNTYRVADWTKNEFTEVCDSMMDNKRAIALDDGIFVLSDIRTIVLVPEPEPIVDEQGEEQQLSPWGFVDHETAKYLKEELGMDIGGAKE